MDNITNEQFDSKLADILSDMTGSELLGIPGLYEVVAEQLNDEVLDMLFGMEQIMVKKEELEKALDKDLIYNGDWDTDNLIVAYWEYLSLSLQNILDLFTDHPSKAWALLNFLDTINRYDLDYAYENLAWVLIEQEEEEAKRS